MHFFNRRNDRSFIMMKFKSAATSLLVLALGLAAQAQAHAAGPVLDYGVVTSDVHVTGRVIEVKPETRYLNVRNGEVVTIHVGDTSFTWEVNTAPNVNAIPLAKIVPAGAPATMAWVYIAENELYQGD
jgi:phosphodiesterase/alkaline phosphatase D-like protein